MTQQQDEQQSDQQCSSDTAVCPLVQVSVLGPKDTEQFHSSSGTVLASTTLKKAESSGIQYHLWMLVLI